MSSYHQHTIPSLTAKPDSSVTPPSELPQPPVNTRLPLGSIYPDGNTMSLNTPHRSTTVPSAANKSTGPPPRPFDQPRLPEPTTSSYNMTPSQSYHSTHHYPHPSQTLPPISHYSRQLSENHSIRLPPLSSVSSRADLGVKGPPLHPPYTPSPAYPPARKHVPQSAVDHHLPEMSTPTSSTPSSSSRMKKTPASSVLVTPSVFDSPTLARMQEDEIPIVIIPKVHSGGSLNLGGIQVPADFPGNYPEEYNRRGPVPELKKGKRSSKVEDDEAEDGDPSDLKKTNRQSQSSRNPWDYVVEDKHEKQRRRFQNSELQVLEILWSISQSPNKYQRQRLGGWLGVPTKHITVWFQNRRQDTKRFSKEKSNPPSSSSRANRGTYDPITGKWRPVPLSCISSVEPPPKVKLRAVNAIAVGDVTREDYFTWFPSSNGNNGGSDSIAQGANPTITSAKHLRPTVGRTVSSSLDDILSAREAPFARPRASRRGNSDFCLSGEGEERNQNMLALMSSSPPSSGAIREMRPAGDDVFEDDETDVEADDRSTTGSSSVNARSQASIGLGHPVARPPRRDLATLGRATSLDLVAASTRARHLIHPHPPRAVSGQSGVKAPVKMYRAVPTHSSNDEEYHRTTKRPKITPMSNVVANYRAQDSFQRSTSQSAIDVSYEEERGHVSSTPSPSSLTTPVNTSPEDGSVRRVSSSFSGGLQCKPHGQTVYSSAVATHVRRTSGGNETDKEVLDAAAQLLSIFGGAQTA